MGVWGYGNFESDDAMNVLFAWINKIIGQIQEVFSDESENVYREGDAKIVANIDILITLIEKYELYIDLFLTEVIEWKVNYLNAYDEAAKRRVLPEGIEFAKQRRIVVVETFDKFIEMITKMVNEKSDDI
jgi:hypothetical protein